MPWCEFCAKYMAPSALKTDGTCPKCGKLVTETTINGRVTARNLDLKKLAQSGEVQEDVSIPWHFKVLVGLLVIYLSWRVIQLFDLIG